ncbi:MAG: prolyl oligopeptidase family serine peptidase [Blastopirellula sp. JB062]
MTADSPAAGKQVSQTLEIEIAGSDARKISYLLYLPADYQADGAAKPLLLFLHGAGERGNDLELVKKHGPPKLAVVKSLPFIVVSPQCPTDQWWNAGENLEALSQLLNAIQAQYAVDPKQIYCTGLSMGGYGVLSLVAKHPYKFAAAISICGGGDPAQADRFQSTPLWAFHGDADEVVPLKRSEEMIAAVQDAGGDAKLTIYPGVKHDSWSATYDNPEVYDWLLSHVLRQTE